MAKDVKKTVWYAKPPIGWPQAPGYLSFTSISDLEACPRRWALTSANYPDIWDRKGYPSIPNLPALAGTVVHIALEQITRRLSICDYSSNSDNSSVKVLRELGGFSSVIQNSINRSLMKYEDNPRAIRTLDRLRHRLYSQKGELRIRLQNFLSRLSFEQEVGHMQSGEAMSDRSTALPLGSHPEVKLKVPELRWYGIADLITLSPSKCEIRDFKTGTPNDKHHSQIYTYSLLWWRDRILNPSGRLANRLVLSYDSDDVDVPALTSNDLKHFEGKLRRRVTSALTAIEQSPPEAIPNTENCIYCEVRHLCDHYWDYFQCLEDHKRTTYYGDIQLKIVGRHGTTSWDGIVDSCKGIKTGSQILFRTSELPFIPDLNYHLRVLNSLLSLPYTDPSDGNSTPAVATMGTRSEAFLLSTKD